jgi:hypothetical protein
MIRHLIGKFITFHTGGRYTIILADANACALKFEEENVRHKDLALHVGEYLLETSSHKDRNYSWRWNVILMHRLLLY